MGDHEIGNVVPLTVSILGAFEIVKQEPMWSLATNASKSRTHVAAMTILGEVIDPAVTTIGLPASVTFQSTLFLPSEEGDVAMGTIVITLTFGTAMPF